MGLEDLIEGLVRELGLAGNGDAEELVGRWFRAGEAVAGAPPVAPEPVQAVESLGPETEAVYTRAGQLQMLMTVVAGAKAELEEATVRQDRDAADRLRKALDVLVAFSEEEDEAIQAALRARLN
jgi:hypothetical protein